MGLLALLTLLFVGIQNAYPALSGSDLFQLAEISVIGNRLLEEHTVVQQSALSVGGDLFGTDLAAATDRLTAHPMIRHALLVRQPPEGLVISIEEREPIALVLTPEGVQGLDDAGSCFPLPQARLDLPVVTGLEKLSSGEATAVAALVSFAQTLSARAPALWENMSEIHVVRPGEALVYLVGDGLRLRMRFEDAEAQARNFQAYEASLTGRPHPAAYIDLRFTNQVVVGTHRGGAPGEVL